MTLVFEDIQQKYFDEVIDICNSQFGFEYFKMHWLEAFVKEKDTCFVKVVLDENEQVLGFCLNQIIKQNEIVDYLKLSSFSEFDEFFGGFNQIGVLKTICVKPGLTKFGIGTQLIQRSMDEFQKRNVNKIASVAWKSANGINIDKSLRKFGLSPIVEVPNFWSGLSCGVCGDNCICSAVIYLS